MIACYDGPPGTEDVGACVGGVRTCANDGSSYGDCIGQVLPAPAEDCSTPDDDDCDGMANEDCVTYAGTAQPIFQAHCAPCHTVGKSGGVNFASNYADTQGAAYPAACAGLNVGACALVRIKNGSMPKGKGCSGDPAMDAGKAACLTAAEQAALDAWIKGGELP
jgi:hypothetical protein